MHSDYPSPLHSDYPSPLYSDCPSPLYAVRQTDPLTAFHPPVTLPCLAPSLSPASLRLSPLPRSLRSVADYLRARMTAAHASAHYLDPPPVILLLERAVQPRGPPLPLQWRSAGDDDYRLATVVPEVAAALYDRFGAGTGGGAGGDGDRGQRSGPESALDCTDEPDDDDDDAASGGPAVPSPVRAPSAAGSDAPAAGAAAAAGTGAGAMVEEEVEVDEGDEGEETDDESSDVPIYWPAPVAPRPAATAATAVATTSSNSSSSSSSSSSSAAGGGPPPLPLPFTAGLVAVVEGALLRLASSAAEYRDASWRAAALQQVVSHCAREAQAAQSHSPRSSSLLSVGAAGGGPALRARLRDVFDCRAFLNSPFGRPHGAAGGAGQGKPWQVRAAAP